MTSPHTKRIQTETASIYKRDILYGTFSGLNKSRSSVLFFCSLLETLRNFKSEHDHQQSETFSKAVTLPFTLQGAVVPWLDARPIAMDAQIQFHDSECEICGGKK